ncbi:MAG TPA: sigma 54-interacting transcriptional regulator [Kofleriaceae bacterium]|nr:sigma 54-interacting transcriptional regulator [Kofleriaceae bacterium]
MDPTATSPTAALGGSAPPAIHAFRVDIVRGPDAGLVTRADGERLVVGTHRSADLILTDRTVSRFHCELVIDGDALQLRDLGSRNGTVIDNVEVEAVRLRGPSIITLGGTEIRVDVLAETVELELAPQERFGQLVGISAPMRQAFARLQKAAERSSNVLIEGEPGTGKDAAAAALHEASARANRPLDVVDCGGAVLEVEAELFGRRDRAGALERCRGGTLVLDDVGALSSGTQRTLVRAIESRQVRRVGTDQAIDIDVRLIALSRRNLRVEVNAERFREDLFQLLAVLPVRLPPLRERAEDLPLLVSHALEQLDARDRRAGARLLAAESIERLRQAPWPGNVRELRASIERAVAADGNDPDRPPELDAPLIDGSIPLRDARKRWVRYFERTYLRDLVARTGGNVSAAAIMAGVDRVHLHRLITRCGLRGELPQDE